MLVALPVIVPLVAAALCVVAWGRRRAQAMVALAATGTMVVASVGLLATVRNDGVQALAVGGWAAPFGIALVADLLGALMTLLGSIVGLAVVLFSAGATDRRRAAQGHYPLVLCLLAAVSGAFLTGDLFNLYVWFELMLLSSFVLLTLGGERAQLEGAVKYVTLNLLSSIIFLSTAGLVYGATGTLNLAQLSLRLDELEDARLATAFAAPLLVAFGIKAAVFPFFFWLPASYHTPPPAVSALFAGLLTKVGVYSIIRACTLLFDQEWGLLADAILVVAGFTMVTGVLGAVAQNDMRRILSFHIVSQIGYMLMGLGIALAVLAAGDPDDPATRALAAAALAGSVFYVLHHIVVKTNLFLVSGAVIEVRGSSTLARLGGIVSTNPMLAALFLVSALSLAGIPILSGFWAKLALVKGGFDAGEWPIVAISLAVSLLTLLSMTKIWSEGFWRAVPRGVAAREVVRTPRTLALPIVLLAIVTVSIGLFAGPVHRFALETADQLLDQSSYIEAVLPGATTLDAPGPELSGVRPAPIDGGAP